MRIGHYASRLWARGGISTYVQRLGLAQHEHGHDIVFFSRHGHPEGHSRTYVQVEDDEMLFRECAEHEIDILHIHSSLSTFPPDRLPVIRTMHGHQGGCPSGSRYLKRPGRPCPRIYSLSGCLWGHVVNRCGSVRPKKLWGNFQQTRQERQLTTKIPTVTVSEFVREEMIRAGCAEENLYTVHSPAPAVRDEFQPVERAGVPRFLFLGRLVPQKGVDWVIKALTQTEHPAHLDIAGEGPMLEGLRTLAREEGVTERVTFHGWLEDDAIVQLLSRTRAVVVPSVWHEPAGLVSLEAAAQGRPVIASRVGGIPEYARPDFSLIVDPHDIDAMAEAIDTLAQDADQADQMGRAAHTAARDDYAMHDFLRQMDNHYRQSGRQLDTRRAS